MNDQNHLKNETSPYLLQHAENPVNWYPWCEEAFHKAKTENKPVFLSIGYSTCHWCHVMAHESFENIDVAQKLNEHFISIKVDKEERPDIDSIYMNVCQTLTGSGGWPTTIFMTPEQKPFFAGTYFPSHSKYGMIGFTELITRIHDKWTHNQEELLRSSEEITEALRVQEGNKTDPSMYLIREAVNMFTNSFDKKYGGFGSAPKFPSPHNLIFLMQYYKKTKDSTALEMVEKTLIQMYKGGIFDHIGFGFSRYSTDQYYLAPHFEKMLYDNALLMIAYITAYDITKKDIYKTVAEKTAQYVLQELTDKQGGFYCAQDADSEGIEGKYYVFEYHEILTLLGDDIGKKFNGYYDITEKGNFEGKNIPNLIQQSTLSTEFEQHLPQIYRYRKTRTKLHLDDKILTSWNALMIAAFALLYRVLGDQKYLEAAQNSCDFIDKNLSEGDTLYVSYREGKKSGKGFLDDYAFYVYALIQMYEATLEKRYLERALNLHQKILKDFHDNVKGCFFLYGQENETLILRPKETYDGAIPSGNAVMSYNLIKLARICKDLHMEEFAQEHLAFMASHAKQYPTGHSFYLTALTMFLYPSKEIVCVLKDKSDKELLKGKFDFDTYVSIFEKPTEEYPLLNDKTTFYLCENRSCKPPTNDLQSLQR